MIAVIGDIHGCVFTLEKLLIEIKRRYHTLPVYCVGDLIDRGNFSVEVIDLVISEKIIFTPGNHDYMFYHFIRHPGSSTGRAWLFNGYSKTLSSYNNRIDKINLHIDLIAKAPLFLNLQDCFISHAGISHYYKKRLPRSPLEDEEMLSNLVYTDFESPHSVLWNRDKLLNLGKLQVVGHTPMDKIKLVKNNNSLYIDTSAYTGNLLSAVFLDKGKIADSFSMAVSQKDIE